jgi:hypothetical protein
MLVAVGCALVAAFFLSWTADWGGGGTSGWQIAHEHRWLYAIPLGGLLLALVAGSRASYTRHVAFAVGALVVGDFAYHLLRGIVQSNLETWLLLGGGATMLVGMAPERRVLRAIGGVAVLLGLFAPWQSHDGWYVSLSFDLVDLVSMLGVAIILIYVTAIAAVVAIASSFTERPWGRTAAMVAGLAVFVTYFWLLLAVAKLFLGWGAWITLGGSAFALVLSLVAPGDRDRAVREVAGHRS